MKKSDLVTLIREIVSLEVRKQLPTVISEVFSNFISENKKPSKKAQPLQENVTAHVEEVEEDGINLNSSLKELFSGVAPSQTPQPVQQKQKKVYTKNQMLNEALNDTIGLRAYERQKMPQAAFMSSMTADISSGFEMQRTNVPFDQPVAEEYPSPSYLNNVPSMDTLIHKSPPPVLREGQESSYAPLQSIPNGVSVLDMKNQAPAAVSKALTRNYAQMMKLIDNKKKMA